MPRTLAATADPAYVASPFDPGKYGQLLLTVLPVAIETDEEHARLLLKAEELMARHESLAPEEAKLLKLLAGLIHAYESRKLKLGQYSDPAGMLQHLMEARDLKQIDLVPIVGSRGTVSAIVSGKRGISKEMAKKLAAFFHVSADLFL
ncbi:MAG: helix-turn-helix domain-containing protein [Bryobacterales bacterium]|nr:helix-turn-helix domain-containing protein [Bryobacterales bacterium]